MSFARLVSCLMRVFPFVAIIELFGRFWIRLAFAQLRARSATC
ncbi:MAG TPA: hypothetical protein VMZ32_06640 [Gammaproteobacteria bacterium]|nr:hypothetical protein [Gammaproteobacteria bacterium]